MNSEKIILSFPFSGALYSFVDETLLDRRYAAWSKGYYTWLFGKDPNRWRTLALTFTVLYPEIILVPKDHPLPKKVGNRVESAYEDNDLGLVVEWDDYRDVMPQLHDQVKEDMQDQGVIDLLKLMRLQPDVSFELLSDIRYEMYLAQKHQARIFCAKGRKTLVDYLIRKDNARRIQTPLDVQVSFTQYQMKITQLEFNFKRLDDLYAIKEDEAIIQYASSFRGYLNSLKNQPNRESNFAALTQEALEKSELARKYAQRAERLAGYFSWIGLMPVIGGPLVTALEKGLDAVSSKAEADVKRHEWVDFAPEIPSALARSNRLKNLGKSK